MIPDVSSYEPKFPCTAVPAESFWLRIPDLVWRFFYEREPLLTDAEVATINDTYDEQVEHGCVCEETRRALLILLWAAQRRTRYQLIDLKHD
jgi:hypothetical protein